ncbi:hypothetical protein DAMA08_031040 [Martiniozyma asiatica (nom. inval.)]|nr:hypothetical protein DAMA08_031040 [Martiniozyma asiatica]
MSIECSTKNGRPIITIKPKEIVINEDRLILLYHGSGPVKITKKTSSSFIIRLKVPKLHSIIDVKPITPNKSVDSTPKVIETEKNNKLSVSTSKNTKISTNTSNGIAKRRRMRPKHPLNRHMIHIPPILQINGLNQNVNNEEDDLVESSVRLTINDPITQTLIQTPMRTAYCSHNECFDFDTFLALNHLKPFKVQVMRHSEVSKYPGDVQIGPILYDSRRLPISIKEHNKNVIKYEHKSKLKELDSKNKYKNELEWFCCPICMLEFNIKTPGDLYVVGEFCDLLQDLKLEGDYEEIDELEIDLINKGQWKWIKTEVEQKEKFERKIKENNIEVVELSDEEFSDEVQTQPQGTINKPEETDDEEEIIDEELEKLFHENFSIPVVSQSNSLSSFQSYNPQFQYANEQPEQQQVPEQQEQLQHQPQTTQYAKSESLQYLRSHLGVQPQPYVNGDNSNLSVVQFRPYEFTQQEPLGNEDDPIVLD